jgi:hypothetical protein
MNIPSAARMLTVSAFAILGAVWATAPAMAADSHRHDAPPAVLKLDDGARWQTDAALRTGMESIRGAVAHALPEVHAGRFSAAQYQALGDSVEQQVGYIVQNCKLEPAADEMLHAVIAEIGKGVDVIAGRTAGVEREQGVVHLVGALDAYAGHFEHPGWKALETGH